MARLAAISALGIVLVIALASSGQAQKDVDRNESGAVSGKVLSVDAENMSFQIQEADGTRWTFRTNGDTTYKTEDKAIGLSDLKKGWSVAVNYDETETGNLALFVEVTDTP